MGGVAGVVGTLSFTRGRFGADLGRADGRDGSAIGRVFRVGGLSVEGGRACRGEAGSATVGGRDLTVFPGRVAPGWDAPGLPPDGRGPVLGAAPPVSRIPAGNLCVTRAPGALAPPAGVGRGGVDNRWVVLDPGCGEVAARGGVRAPPAWLLGVVGRALARAVRGLGAVDATFVRGLALGVAAARAADACAPGEFGNCARVGASAAVRARAAACRASRII